MTHLATNKTPFSHANDFSPLPFQLWIKSSLYLETTFDIIAHGQLSTSLHCRPCEYLDRLGGPSFATGYAEHHDMLDSARTIIIVLRDFPFKQCVLAIDDSNSLRSALMHVQYSNANVDFWIVVIPAL